MTVVENSLGLAWNGLETDHDQCKNTYQEPVLTEFATLGLACILLTRHTDLRISEVTRRGEKVDYWIGDDAQRKQFVLEVGGLQNGNIDNLSNDKITQSVQNPWGRDGYVCVAVFGQLRSRLWYFLHRSGT